MVIEQKALQRGMPQYFFCHFKVWLVAAARRCQVLLDMLIFDSK